MLGMYYGFGRPRRTLHFELVLPTPPAILATGAGMNTTGLAVIGCGARPTELLKELTRHDHIEVVGAWQPTIRGTESFCQEWRQLRKSESPQVYASLDELLADKRAEWVMVSSPNVFHAEHIVGAFKAGKHVFAEKPLATTITDAQAVIRAHAETGRIFATGFTLRYSPVYRTAHEIVSSGRIGRIVSIDATENISPSHGAYIMTNWRRHREKAGPHVLEKCVHDLDLLNWITDSLPVRVAAFGGNSMYTRENASLFQNANEAFTEWPATAESGLDPFTTDKSIEDHMVAILEYESGAKVQFQATMSNPIAERRMYISGTEGTLTLDLVAALLRCRTLTDASETTFDGIGGGVMHGGGDEIMIRALADTMATGTKPAIGAAEAFASTAVGLAIERAWKEGIVFDLRPLWESAGIDPAGSLTG